MPRAHNKITQAELKAVLDYDPITGVFHWRQSGVGRRRDLVAGCVKTDGYIAICINYKHYKAHRLAWLYVHGYLPEETIDHINRNKTDNRLVNLREASDQCQKRNYGVQRNSSSGVKGVGQMRNGSWHAVIYVDGSRRHIGCFKSKLEAAYARYAAEQCLGYEEYDYDQSTKKFIDNHK